MVGEETELKQLQKEIKELRAEINSALESPFLQASVKSLVYEILLDRTAILEHELGKRINEKHGTMYEIKQQARRMAWLLGLDADNVRLLVTEAVQNILEHGTGRWVQVRLEMQNEGPNPCMVSSFKHEIPASEKYTMHDVDMNALKGDITSEFFDFESHRGRGEFIMKQLTDERRIINGIEVNRDGKKVHYFKRVLINYKNADGPRGSINFQEIKEQIDRLGFQDVICCFLIQHSHDKPDHLTVAAAREHSKALAQMMLENNCKLVLEESYFSNVFSTFEPVSPLSKEQLQSIFEKVKAVVYRDAES
ncbi:MAG: ATP-binding protein [Leptospirales bacterium]|nr:ATP-binding protein [Leptospirales bacterium]